MKTIFLLALMFLPFSISAKAAESLVCTAGEPGTESFIRVIKTDGYIQFKMLEMSLTVPMSAVKMDGNSLLISNEKVVQETIDPQLWTISARLKYSTTIYGWNVRLTLLRTDYPMILVNDQEIECRN